MIEDQSIAFQKRDKEQAAAFIKEKEEIKKEYEVLRENMAANFK